jgi:quinol monooxygenase YgiN
MKKILFAILLSSATLTMPAQDKTITRVARITVDPLQLQAYHQLLKLQMETAVREEPGVISYNVYEDKADPSQLTIIEVYADDNAYIAHREAPHFKQYKAATKDMVTSLELSEVNPVFSSKKKDN